MNNPQHNPRIDPRVQEAREHYRKLISPEMEAANLDRFVVIDTDSDDFELGDDLIELSRTLRARRPNGRITGFRVGLGGKAIDRFHSCRIQ